MLYAFLLLIIIVAAILLWIVFDLRKKMESGQDAERIAVVLEKLDRITWDNKDLRQTVDAKLSEAHKATRENSDSVIRTIQGITGQSARQIADVVAGLTKLEETNRQVVNFSAQLQNLQDILKNPKQRGVLGEYFLEETLKNVLPPNSYQMQYKFQDGTIVDAAVFVQEKVVPIDSKFSLENYERILNSRDPEERERLEKSFKQDLKNRIDETSKYIKPEEGTMDFAFMFIPSEAIYYDLLVNKVGAVQISTRDLIEYAFCEKKVIIVSPTSFLAYLQTVLQGLRALKIEESAKQIRVGVEKLRKHVSSYDELLRKMGNSLGTTVNQYNQAFRELGKIDKDIAKITEGEKMIEPLAIERPSLED